MNIHVEIFIASRILGQNQGTFTPLEIRKFIKKEFNDTQEGIKTQTASMCVANSPLNFNSGFNFLWREKHGVYRVFKPGFDLPFVGRENDPFQPKWEDVPVKYQYFLDQSDPNLPQESASPPLSEAKDNDRIDIPANVKPASEKKSYRSSASFGKRMEYVAVGKLLQLGHDVYMTLVDDQQIDCVIRQEKDGELRYLDIQIKARSSTAKNPGLFAAMEIRKPRDNFFYIFYSESANMYWVIPSLDLLREANTNKEGKNKGKISIKFANVGSKGTNPRPRFTEYENAFHLLEWK